MEEKIAQPPIWPVSSLVKLIIGAFLALAGVLLTLDNLGLFYAHPFLRYWPLVLVLIGAVKLSANSGPVFGIVLMVVGGWMLLYNLHWIHFTIFHLWPLFLVGFGASIIARAIGWTPHWPDMRSSGGTLAVLASRNVVVTSRNYKGGEITVFLGGCQLDLTGAAISESPAVLDVTSILGGVEIFVPDEWEVIGEVVPILGGFEIKARTPAPTSGQLIVRGMALLGGIEVKSGRRMS